LTHEGKQKSAQYPGVAITLLTLNVCRVSLAHFSRRYLADSWTSFST